MWRVTYKYFFVFSNCSFAPQVNWVIKVWKPCFYSRHIYRLTSPISKKKTKPCVPWNVLLTLSEKIASRTAIPTTGTSKKPHVYEIPNTASLVKLSLFTNTARTRSFKIFSQTSKAAWIGLPFIRSVTELNCSDALADVRFLLRVCKRFLNDTVKFADENIAPILMTLFPFNSVGKQHIIAKKIKMNNRPVEICWKTFIANENGPFYFKYTSSSYIKAASSKIVHANCALCNYSNH